MPVYQLVDADGAAACATELSSVMAMIAGAKGQLLLPPPDKADWSAKPNTRPGIKPPGSGFDLEYK